MINKNNNKWPRLRPHKVQVTGLAAAVALVSGPLWAGETLEFDNGATLDWSVTTSYGIGMRLGAPSDRLMGINADDPNRNFDQHSLTTNRIGALGEMILRKDNYGAVVRASFNTRVGRRVLMTLTQNGKPLPFGATITTDDKDSEFIVGNDGQTYLSGLPQHGKLSVNWGQGASEHCVAEYALTDEKDKTSIINAAAQCQ